MTENWKIEFAREWIISSANDAEFIDVTEALFDENVDDPNNEIAKEILSLINRAEVEVTWNE
jgi:hypothetical protein